MGPQRWPWRQGTQGRWRRCRPRSGPRGGGERGGLPAPHAGDEVLIGNTGAYTTCYSGGSAFNGYPAPAVRILS